MLHISVLSVLVSLCVSDKVRPTCNFFISLTLVRFRQNIFSRGGMINVTELLVRVKE